MEKQVLIVEDDQNISELLSIHLKDMNCEPVTVDNGQVGLDKALEEKYDLIVLDINLPGKDGLDV